MSNNPQAEEEKIDINENSSNQLNDNHSIDPQSVRREYKEYEKLSDEFYQANEKTPVIL